MAKIKEKKKSFSKLLLNVDIQKGPAVSEENTKVASYMCGIEDTFCHWPRGVFSKFIMYFQIDLHL